MYAIMGITGQVGSATARHLLDNGQRVRAIVRDKAKAATWAARGAEIAVADWSDAHALAAAFSDVDGVFAMLPANFAPSPDFAEPRALVQTLIAALRQAQPPKVVALSSIGAQHDRDLGLITQLHLLESALDTLPLPRAHVRAAWFMENIRWDVALAQHQGRLVSHLQPLDRAIPMVSTDDIGRTIASTLVETWFGRRVIELEGPRRYSPLDMAQALAAVLEHDVETATVQREQWAARFEDEGMPADRTGPRIAMLDGFNSGWIGFENGTTEHVRGRIPLGYVVDELVSAGLDVLESAA
ncbi:NAD-dependent epimerase/dehydratase family protein [Rhodanobacter glycinis]|uniref:NmrA family NAD(P)-binding protein n=1 Tax=Rhodanobacter glycinis TaxID=582702 RepID=UPI0011265448|nr:NAD(P)H-binding protein [Rhodanobacter glycinis]TPG47728.1 NAD-dependent epimerase/dehydratase family protein [Rhodanobacter glycinis]